MRSIITLAFMAICSFSFAQNNLLDTSTWTVGNGPVGGFELYGPSADNERILGTDPHGNNSVLWVSKPEGATTNTADGGYISPDISIDPTKTYRLTVWIKKTGSNSGVPHFGAYAKNASYSGSTANLDGTHNGNPYFWGEDTPQLDKWYLLVAFVHPYSYSGPNLAAMYEGGTGTLITSADIDDVKFESNSTYLLNRSLLYASREATDRMYHWNPTIYEVNGQEPTITELLNPGGNNDGGNSGTTVWNTSGSNINYTAGKVGIGTTTIPNDYLFAVNGKIISEELKVQLHSQWPDYVFAENYSLPSLEEVEKHIQEKGHLVNMPSASEVEANGIEVGEMNKLLLEKIEELTLYILRQEKEMNILKHKVNQLENKPKK